MKVKTFTGTHRFAVDRQVNDWLAKSNVTVHKTNVAFKALRDRGWDAVAGNTNAPSVLSMYTHAPTRAREIIKEFGAVRR